jgi:hypothetical protein
MSVPAEVFEGCTMTDRIIALPVAATDKRTATIGERLKRVAGLFETIHEDELLSAFPDCSLGYENHLTALSLLALAELEIISICRDL